MSAVAAVAAAERAERVDKVAQLRERIRALEAAPRQLLSVVRTGVAAFDGLLPQGGLPLGQAVELWGEAASGRTSLTLRAVAAAQRAGRLCAWVDGPAELYPPTAAALGVDLRALLMVRPRAPGQLVWAAQQLARSGAFACVVLDVTHTGARLGLAEGKKLQDAAVASGTLLLLLTPRDAPADGMLRLGTAASGPDGFTVEVLRSRSGGLHRSVEISWTALWEQGAGEIASERVPDAPPPVGPEGLLEVGYRRRAPGRSRACLGIRGQRPGRDVRIPSGLQGALVAQGS